VTRKRREVIAWAILSLLFGVRATVEEKEKWPLAGESEMGAVSGRVLWGVGVDGGEVVDEP
jgi:hypothetical protein